MSKKSTEKSRFFFIYLIGDNMFLKNIDSKIKLFLIIFIFLFIIIIGRVIYIELFEYKKLSSLANDLWSRDLPIEGDRGLILDRNGVVLADNITTTSLVLIPNQIKDKELVSKELASILYALGILALGATVYKIFKSKKINKNDIGYFNISYITRMVSITLPGVSLAIALIINSPKAGTKTTNNINPIRISVINMALIDCLTDTVFFIL